MAWQLALVAVAILVALPHGSQDRPASPYLYTVTGLLVVVGWLVAPVTTFALFLSLAALHFGIADTRPGPFRWAAAIAMGGSVLVLPAAMNPGALSDQFAALIGPSAIVTYLNLLAVPWVVAAVLTLAVRPERWALVAIMGLYALLPPLVAFAAYFTWHGLKDWEGVNLRRLAISAGLLAVGFATLLLGGPPTLALYQALFVGLAALATPHILWNLTR